MNDTLDHADCFKVVCYLGALKAVLCGHLQTKKLFVGQPNKRALTTWTQGEICIVNVLLLFKIPVRVDFRLNVWILPTEFCLATINVTAPFIFKVIRQTVLVNEWNMSKTFL